MITNTGDKTEQIRKRISYLVTEVDGCKILGHSSVFKEIEMLTHSIYKVVEGIELIVLDNERRNAETLDLISNDKTLGIQVTCQATSAKVKKTINSFLKNKECKDLKELKIFIYTTKKVKKEYLVENCKVKVLNIYDYLNEIWASSSDKIDKFHQIILEQIALFTTSHQTSSIPITNISSPNLVADEIKPVKSAQETDVNHELISLRPKPTKPVEIDYDQNIIDIIHQEIKTFEGFNFIPKEYIANLKCFNTERKYDDNFYLYNLKTANKKILPLIENLSFESGKLEIKSEDLKPFKKKLSEIFNFLFRMGFYFLSYREGYTDIAHLKIQFKKKEKECNCPRCLFLKLKFNEALTELKKHDTILPKKLVDLNQFAIANFKMGRYDKAFTQFKKILSKGNSIRAPQYFLSLSNLKYINSFLFPGEFDELKTELKKIKLNDELELLTPTNNSKALLRDINYKTYFNSSYTDIEDYVQSIKNVKHTFHHGGNFSGENYSELLLSKLYELYNFHTQNFQVVDEFGFIQKIYDKAFEGLIISHSITKRYKSRLAHFDFNQCRLFLYLTREEKMNTIFVEAGFDKKPIVIKPDEQEKVIDLFINYYKSFYEENNFSGVVANKEIANIDSIGFFSGKLRHTFCKIQLLIIYGDFDHQLLKKLIPYLLKFLKVQDVLQRGNFKFLAGALHKRLLQVFSKEEFFELIEIIIDNQFYFESSTLITQLTNEIKNKPEYLIDDKNLIKKVINNVINRKDTSISDYLLLTDYYKLFNKKLRPLIKAALQKKLTQKFDDFLFHECCAQNIFSAKSFFETHAKAILAQTSQFDIRIEDGMMIIQNFAGINFINFLFYHNISLKNRLVQDFAKKNSFYNWLINHHSFDYSQFQVEWLQYDYRDYVIAKLKKVRKLREIVKRNLNRTDLSASVKLLLD